jgi:HSP20 family protein
MWIYKSFFNWDESEINSNEKEFVIKKLVPGYGKDDLNIQVENGVLSVKSKDESLKFSYSLPDNVNINKIEASCDKGILQLTLPKNKKNSKLIEIK